MSAPRALASVSLLLTAALSLSACGSQSASSALKKWVTSANLVRNDAQLVSDARAALAALGNIHSTAAQLHTVCAVLDVESLQAYAALPSPDAQTTHLLTNAYTALGDGANECFGAAHSEVKRQGAQDYLHQAGAALSEVHARLGALSAL